MSQMGAIMHKRWFQYFLFTLSASSVCILQLMFYIAVIKHCTHKKATDIGLKLPCVLGARLHILLLRDAGTQTGAVKHQSVETDLPSSSALFWSCVISSLPACHPVRKALKWSELLSQLGPAISSFFKEVWNMEWCHFAELTMRTSLGEKIFQVSVSEGLVLCTSRVSKMMKWRCRMTLSLGKKNVLHIL